MSSRPRFIIPTGDLPERTHVYPHSEERMGPVRSAGKAAGLVRVGLNLQRLPPGTRSSWPHAEEDEEEFVYVIEGEVDAWVDLHMPDGTHPTPTGTYLAACVFYLTLGNEQQCPPIERFGVWQDDVAIARRAAFQVSTTMP